jgi:hypothetical protein
MSGFLFDLLQKGDRTEYLPNRCGVNPNRPFEGWTLEKSHSLRQGFSKSLLNEAPQKKVGRKREDEKCEKNVVYQKDHTKL